MMKQTDGNDASNEHHTGSKPEPTRHARWQFDLQSMFWLTVTISVALVALRTAGQQSLVQALAVIALAAAAGVLIGAPQHRVGPVVYWSVLGASFAFIGAVGGSLVHWTTPFAWAAVGALSGCAVGSTSDRAWWQCMLAGGLAAGLAMGFYATVLHAQTRLFDAFDVLSSLPIGAFFGLLVVLIRVIERRSTLRHDALATVLMTAIVIGNHLSRYFVPVGLLAVTLCLLSGCGTDRTSDVDPAPFEQAISQYLQQNNMALKIKKIRSGPSIDNDTAAMSASMTHQELEGPSVVWNFTFQRDNNGQWSVTRHSDR